MEITNLKKVDCYEQKRLSIQQICDDQEGRQGDTENKVGGESSALQHLFCYLTCGFPYRTVNVGTLFSIVFVDEVLQFVLETKQSHFALSSQTGRTSLPSFVLSALLASPFRLCFSIEHLRILWTY
jgi:hypothetical protein